MPDHTLDRAVIVGCGFAGTALARRLAERGVGVAATSRTGRDADGGRVRSVDLTSEAPLELPEARGAVVYYLVGPLCHELAESRTHLRPLDRVLGALCSARPCGVIYVSSTSVYGDRAGGWVSEETSTAPDSPWGRMRVDLEERVHAFGEECGLPASVVRLPEIYGPGRGPISRLQAGYRVRFPDRYSNRIHLEDLVTILVRLGERLDQKVLLAADGTPALVGEVYDYAATLLGWPAAPRGDATELPSDPNHLALLRDSKRCDTARLRQWLGEPLRYPNYREGLLAIAGR
ncbi:MAG: NAD-dependent epimerase/dehydratase family protein [Deltaproteobacteria bacterium]|nr:NAD-dependent epimerase/dehydratase family protein [Deltaproteobacteria bacterium]